MTRTALLISMTIAVATPPAQAQITLADLLTQAREAAGPAPGTDQALSIEGVDETSGWPVRWLVDGRGRIRFETQGDPPSLAVWDGASAWMTDRGAGPFTLSGMDRERLILLGWVVGGFWLDEESPLEPVPESLVAHEALRLLVTVPGGVVEARVGMGMDDLLPDRIEMGEAGPQYRFSEILETGDWNLPRRVELTDTEGHSFETVRLDSVTLVPVDEGWFERPAPARAGIRFGKAGATTVPLRAAESGHPLIPARFDGDEVDRWLVFDSGAATSMIDPELADELGFADIRDALLTGAGADGPSSRRVRSGPDLTIGSATLSGIEWKESGRFRRVTSGPNGEPIAGVIGWDLLARAAVVVDAAAELMTIAESGTLEPPGTRWHPLFLQWNVPYLEAVFPHAGKSIERRFMLDTGAGRLGAAFFHHAVEELGLGAADAPIREAHGAGGRLEVAVTTLPWIELDGTRIEEPATLFSQQEDGEADPFSVGVLGMGVLDRFRVTFDYLANRLGLVPVTAAVSGQGIGRNARVAGQIVAAFNEPDAASRRERLNAVFGDRERNQHIATALGFLAERHGHVSVEEIAESGPTWATVVLRGEKEGDFLTLEIEYEAPDGDALGSLGFRPGRPAAQAGPALDAASKREVIDAIAGLVRTEYAIASERGRLGDAIESWDDALFGNVTDGPRFASRLTMELRRLQDDKHFAVFSPGRSVGRFESPDEPADDHQGHQMPGQGFGRVEVLDGNVGYIQMEGFDGSEAGIQRVRAIMASLDTVAAMIIDLRGCLGGEPGMVVELSSFFFAEPTHLATSVSPWAEGPQERWTHLPPIDHFTTLPVLVLTGGMTASAAESFVFGLERHGRITTVGEVTAGAGHLADVRRLPGGFGLQLPVGRTYDPETGKGWEGVGIPPDVPTAAENALRVALARLLGGAASR